ncbi:MAG: hypothetical protein ACR2LI_13715 [Propionibacteriaceae bacterium]
MTADRGPDDRPDDERAAADQPVGPPIDETPTEGSGDVAEGVNRPRETSDAEIDALFAELVAGYPRTAGPADRVHPTHADPVIPDRPAGESSPRGADPGLADRIDIEPQDARPRISPPSGPQPISGPTDAADRADTHPGVRPDTPTSDPSSTHSPAVHPSAVHPPAVRPPAVHPPAIHPPAVHPPAIHPPATADPTTESRWRASPGVEVTHDEAFERYRPELHPIGRPRWPVVAGWGGMLFAVVATLLAIFGVPVPGWVGWLSVGGFLGGFGLLVAQLPRHRPPDAGDGAVL